MFHALGPYISAIHAKDRKLHVTRGVPAGQGDLDYARFVALCREHVADLPLIVGHVPDVTRKAVEAVRKGGSCVLIGQQDPDTLRNSGFEQKNVSLLYSVCVHLYELEESIRLMRTKEVDVGPLVTDVYRLEEIEAAFAAARKGIKVMLEP